MKRVAIAIALAAVALALAAQPIQIPEVVVAGQSTLRDTLHTQQRHDLQAFWKVAGEQRFAYRYQPPFATSPVAADTTAHDGLIAVDAGTPQLVEVRLAYADRDRPLLNFWTEAGMRAPEDDWETTALRLGWLGHTGALGMRAGLCWAEHVTPLAGATITQVGQTGGLQVNPAVLPTLVTAVNLRYGLRMFREETRAGKREFNEADLTLSTDLAQGARTAHIEAAFLKSSYSAQASVLSTAIPWLDEGGLWVAGDRDHAYASLVFRKRLQVPGTYPRTFALNLFNNPGMGRASRASQLTELPTQRIDGNKLQVKRPLDLHVALEYNTFLSASLEYRLAWLQDCPVYARGLDSLYVQLPVDAWLHEATLSTSYSHSYFRFDNAFTWRATDPEQGDRLPWLAEMEDNLVLRAQLERWSAGLAIRWLAGRKDDLDLTMEDVVLVDLEGHYSLYHNVQLRAAILNLLDEPYRPYALLPAPGTQFRVGFDYHF